MKSGDCNGGFRRVAVVVTAGAVVVVVAEAFTPLGLGGDGGNKVVVLVICSTTVVVEMGDASVGEAPEGGGEANVCIGGGGGRGD